MVNKIGRYLYKFALSIFMAYLIIKSIWIFADYALNYVDKFSAYAEIEIKTEQPITKNKLTEIIPHTPLKIENKSSDTDWSLICQTSDYNDLENVKQKVIRSLDKELTSEGYAVQRAEFFPPPVSKHYFRLQLTVFIPGFIIAIFWFIHFYRWIQNEISEEKKKKKS
jgi:preprotein translocase subunit SecF